MLGHSDRAELDSDEYIAMSTVLEGVVIVKKNPDWKPDDKGGDKDKKWKSWKVFY